MGERRHFSAEFKAKDGLARFFCLSHAVDATRR